MPLDIYSISGVSILIFNMLALAIGLFYCYRNSAPSYLGIIPVYLVVSLMIEILANPLMNHIFYFRPFGNYQRYAENLLYNIYTPFELFVFAWFLFQVIRSNRTKKALVLLLIMFSIHFIAYPMQAGILDAKYFMPVVLECVIIMIPCLVYFRELFTAKEVINLFTEPSFWLVTGIFFYLATVFPLFIAEPYLKEAGFLQVRKSLYSINNFAVGITYLLFIKGFTCRTKKA